MGKHVVVLGGGVAGMTAAHELIERGFSVTVYDRKKIAGGKARSIPVPDSAVGGRHRLPGEHGFRFFPGFYKHVPDTMRRIPYANNPNGVLDNLVSTSRDMLARAGHAPIIALPRFPRSWDDFKLLLKTPEEFHSVGLTNDDLEFFLGKMWQIATSCEERRQNEYGRIGWWDFVDAAKRSKAYQFYLAIGATRTLVASKAELANTKTVGDIGLQLMMNVAEIAETSDRVLNGPTNEVWIDPWLDYLRERGVDYRFESMVNSIECVDGVIKSVKVTAGGVTTNVTADYFLCALPVEVTSTLLTEAILKADPTLAGIQTLKSNVNWMNGIQYFLKEEVPILPGHEIYLSAAWALTSISQKQFWPRVNLANYGDGTVKGVLSVDVSDWTAKGSNGKSAQDCTKDEVLAEVWKQLKEGLNTEGKIVLRDDMIHSAFVDDDIEWEKGNPHKEINLEPLLVNLVNTWDLRPDAFTRIPNFFLASDYIRTHTDLACMEAANEAARRAVNAILYASGSNEALCSVWNLHEPEILAPLRWADRHRYQMGLPWSSDLAKPVEWLNGVKNSIEKLFHR